MPHRIQRTSSLTSILLITAALSGCNSRAPQEWSAAAPSSAAAPVAQAADIVSPGTIHEESPMAPAPAEGPKRSHHALTIIRLAENLQADGKIRQAVEFYRDAVKKHPGTVEAEDASTRILALGGKVPDPSEYSPVAEPGPDPPHVQKPARAAARSQQAPAVVAESPSNWAASPGTRSSGSSAVHVGPRGGVYHISKNGNKVYHSRK
jgi:hypothetical protein